MAVLIWCGPVSSSNISSASWRDGAPRIITINSGPTGVGSSSFAALGSQYRQRYGSPLRGALAAGRVPLDTSEPIALAGFSAAHGLIESILSTPEDAARVCAVGAFDSYYTSAARTPKPGYRAFAARAAAGERRMVLTSSHVAGPTYPSGADATAALLEGLALEPLPAWSHAPAICESATGRAGLSWYVYRDREQAKQTHVQHATVLAPALLPWLLEGLEGSSSSTNPIEIALAAAAGWQLARAAGLL